MKDMELYDSFIRETTDLLGAPTQKWAYKERDAWKDNGESELVLLRYGTLFIRFISPFYLVICINQIISGSLRGAGDSRSCMLIMLGSFVLFRQIYLMIVYRVWGTVLPVAMGYPAGWVLCSVILLLYYRSGAWKKASVFKKKAE